MTFMMLLELHVARLRSATAKPTEMTIIGERTCPKTRRSGAGATGFAYIKVSSWPYMAQRR